MSVDEIMVRITPVLREKRKRFKTHKYYSNYRKQHRNIIRKLMAGQELTFWESQCSHIALIVRNSA